MPTFTEVEKGDKLIVHSGTLEGDEAEAREIWEAKLEIQD